MFDKEWEKVAGAVASHCYSLSQSMGIDQDDLLQETQLKVWRNWAGGAMLTFAKRAALYAAVEMVRRRDRKRGIRLYLRGLDELSGEPVRLDVGSAGGGAVECALTPLGAVYDPWDQVNERLDLAATVAGGSPLAKEVGERVLSGMTIADAAEDLGVFRASARRSLRTCAA